VVNGVMKNRFPILATAVAPRRTGKMAAMVLASSISVPVLVLLNLIAWVLF